MSRAWAHSQMEQWPCHKPYDRPRTAYRRVQHGRAVQVGAAGDAQLQRCVYVSRAVPQRDAVQRVARHVCHPLRLPLHCLCVVCEPCMRLPTSVCPV
jgi:hypothetical protein